MINLNNLIEERAKYIDEQIQSFWVTKENAKEYHIEIVKGKMVATKDSMWYYTSKEMDEYKIYKLVWTFKA